MYEIFNYFISSPIQRTISSMVILPHYKDKTLLNTLPNEIAVIGTGTIPGILKASNTVPSVLWWWFFTSIQDISSYVCRVCCWILQEDDAQIFIILCQQFPFLRCSVLWSLATYLAWYPGHSLFHLYLVSNIIIDSSIFSWSFFQLLHNIFWHSVSKCLTLRIVISSWRIVLFITMEYLSLFIPANFHVVKFVLSKINIAAFAFFWFILGVNLFLSDCFSSMCL